MAYAPKPAGWTDKQMADHQAAIDAGIAAAARQAEAEAAAAAAQDDD